jgi:hypothetical protein
MGHYCRICRRERPNERFSGRGHRIHVCKRCNAKPKSERQFIEDTDEIFGFMRQSHISERNVARLEQMTKSENPQVASLAAIVLKVARAKPYKTRRLKFLARMHPELLRNLEDTGLVHALIRDPETAMQSMDDAICCQARGADTALDPENVYFGEEAGDLAPACSFGGLAGFADSYDEEIEAEAGVADDAVWCWADEVGEGGE